MISCSGQQDQRLLHIQRKMWSYGNIKYQQTGFYPNPVGMIDTVTTKSSLFKNNKSLIGYDFIIEKEGKDQVFIDGTFRTVVHDNNTVKLYPHHRSKEESDRIKWLHNYSPITLLKQSGWEYEKDTLIGGKTLHNFVRTENDTILKGNKVVVNFHIFLNPKTELLDRFERRAYLNGKLTQKIAVEYADYEFNESGKPLTYIFPKESSTVFYGEEHRHQVLKAGQKAPLFSAKDIEGIPLRMDDHQGKKILLNFSITGCSYCYQALKHFNREEYQLADHVSAFYINPFDTRKVVEQYGERVDIPFPVIPVAKDIGEMYGVSAYPTFFLIDENGIIEKVVEGYDEEFINSLME